MRPDVVKRILSDINNKHLHSLVEKYADAKAALAIALAADCEPEVTEAELQQLTNNITDAKYELASYVNRLEPRPVAEFKLIKSEDDL